MNMQKSFGYLKFLHSIYFTMNKVDYVCMVNLVDIVEMVDMVENTEMVDNMSMDKVHMQNNFGSCL